MDYSNYLQSEEFRSQYPFRIRRFNLGSCSMSYVDEGQGEVMLIIHACPMWSFSFRELIRTYSKQYRVIAIDQIGFGLSDKPVHYDYRIESHIDNLEHFIQDLGLHNILFVMHGRGSVIGSAYAVRYPEEVRGFIFFNSMAMSDFTLPLRLQLCRFRWLGIRLMMRLNIFAWDTLFLKPAVRNAYNFPMHTENGRLPLQRFIEDIPCSPEDDSAQSMFEIESALWTLRKKPALLIWGMKDWLYGDQCLKKWTQYFPYAGKFFLPKAGRYLMEDAGEEVIAIIDLFLEQLNKKVKRNP